MGEHATPLQDKIGSRVRARRHALGQTLQQLAQASGVSARFLSDLEAGRANISITRLDAIARALQVPLTGLFAPTPLGPRAAIEQLLAGCDGPALERVLDLVQIALGQSRPRFIALNGVRGCGKSSVGAGLGRALSLPFIELDGRIEERAGMSVGDIFTLHGESQFRALQLACLQDLVNDGRPAVVALPGGVVASERAWALSRSACTCVWLQASPEDLWSRVFAQGDTRPMRGRADAMADLRALMEARAPKYAQADLVADTSTSTIDQIVSSLVAELDARGLVPTPRPRAP